MLELRDLWKKYEGKPLLEGISLQIREGETVCLLGPSGSGKSTLLRITAGLEQPDRGQVCWDGVEITRMPVHRREFGLMFQDYALFPHLNVAENVAFGLRMKKESENRIREAVGKALERVNLASFERRRVSELSGGEQQRVALARALAPEPKMLMLDEPLGALDRTLREELIGQLRRLLRHLKIPSIYVTHDQEEAFAIAERVALLHAGRIVQMGTPEELITHPESIWVARFLGLGNILRGAVRSTKPLRVENQLGEFEIEGENLPPRIGEEVWILLRSGGGTLGRNPIKNRSAIRGVVKEAVRRGGTYQVVLQADNGEEVVCSSPEPIREGEHLTWIPDRGVWLKR